MKKWRGNNLRAETADDAVHKIKMFLIDGINGQPIDKAEKLALEIQVLEL